MTDPSHFLKGCRGGSRVSVGWSGAEVVGCRVGVGMLRGRGVLGFLVFVFLVSKFKSFLVSKFQGFTNTISVFR